MPTSEKKLRDPRTGAVWVKKPKRPEAYVIRMIQHGGRLHVGIPRKLTESLNLQRGDLVMIEIRGQGLSIERLKIVAKAKTGGVL